VIFNKDGICELESIETVDECEAYTIFLLSEERRHCEALDVAEGQVDRAGAMDCPFTKAYAQFFDSAAKRHQQDLDGITKRIAEIEAHKAKLGDKCRS